MYRWAREESKRQPTKRGEQHQKPAPGARLLVQRTFPAQCRWWGSGARMGGAGRQAWWGPAQHTGVRRVRGRAPAPKGPHGLRVPLRACEPHGRHSQPRPACTSLGDPHPPLTASARPVRKRPPLEERLTPSRRSPPPGSGRCCSKWRLHRSGCNVILPGTRGAGRTMCPGWAAVLPPKQSRTDTGRDCDG